MEFGLQELLILVAVMIIALILIDGYRRMRQARRNNLDLQAGAGLTPSDDADLYSGELPTGQARVVRRASYQDEAEEHAQAEQVPLRREPSLDDAVLSEAGAGEAEPELSLEGLDAVGEEPAADTPQPAPAEAAEPAAAGEGEAIPVEQVQEVIQINVMAPYGQMFQGNELLESLLACGMRFGDMNIFHRYDDTGDGRALFSMANAVEPGTFDLDAMDRFHTPGVTFFLGLPGPQQPQETLKLMVETTAKLAELLGGELKDERHSALTQQTLEHHRERVQEFERRYQAAQRGQLK